MALLDQFIAEIHSVPAMFFNTVKYCGDENAMHFKEDNEWKFISYNEFAAIVTDISFALIKLGLKKGDRVALMARTSPEWAWCDVAIQAAGGITVCIYPTLTTKETIHIGKNAEAKLLFAGDADTAQRIFEVINDMPGLEKIICMEKGFKGNDSNFLGIEDLMKMGRQFSLEHPEIFENSWRSVQGDDGCTIIYTSGTTGELKGVYYTQQIWLDGAANSMEKMVAGGFPNDCSAVTLTVLPLAHAMERNGTLTAGIATASCFGFAEKPATMLQDMQIIRPTWVQMVPRLWSRMFTGIERVFGASEEGKQVFAWALDIGLQSIDYYTDSKGGVDLSPLQDGTWPNGLPQELADQWRKADELVYSKVRAIFGGRIKVAFSGAARTPIDLHRKLLALTLPVLTGWGLTETTGGIAHDNQARIKFGYCSTMSPGAIIEVQADGELWVKGRGISQSYFNDPVNTKLAFENGWFKTGDIGEVDDEGFVRISDRKKAIIVLDTGKKVAPARIEEIICRSLIVDQLIVAGDDQKYITALIVPVFDNIIALLESKNIALNKDKFVYENLNGIEICTQVPQEIIDMPLVKELIDIEIKTTNQQLDDFETIKNYVILNKRFSEEEGELTPTQKVKTSFVLKKYSDIIDKMY